VLTHASIVCEGMLALVNTSISPHCLKNDTDVADYNFNAHQLILAIFGKDVAERVCYRMAICYPTSPN